MLSLFIGAVTLGMQEAMEETTAAKQKALIARLKAKAKDRAMALVLVNLPMVTVKAKALAVYLTASMTTAVGAKLIKRLRLWLRNA